MIYEESINQFEKLKNLLIFQERRNFFNRIEDKHLNASIKIVEAILNKSYDFEFSYIDLSEVITITVQIISLLNISDEVKEHLNLMKESSIELKKHNLDFINNNLTTH